MNAWRRLSITVLGFEVLRVETAGDQGEPWDSGMTGSTPFGFVANTNEAWEPGVDR